MSAIAAKLTTSGLSALFTQLTTPDETPIEFLDPLCVIGTLAVIGEKPTDTRISIRNNRIYIQDPGHYQSVERLWNRDKRDQLHQLRLPILYFRGLELGFIKTQHMDAKKEHFNYFNQKASQGLKKLRQTYENSKRTGSMIKNCLDDFIRTLSHPYTKEEYQMELDIINKPTLFVIYNEFMKKWNIDDLQAIIMLFGFVKREKGDAYCNQMTNAINQFIMAKDIEIDVMRPG